MTRPIFRQNDRHLLESLYTWNLLVTVAYGMPEYDACAPAGSREPRSHPLLTRTGVVGSRTMRAAHNATSTNHFRHAIVIVELEETTAYYD
jgi:hypothetical protein